jgi:hypothetical protein
MLLGRHLRHICVVLADGSRMTMCPDEAYPGGRDFLQQKLYFSSSSLPEAGIRMLRGLLLCVGFLPPHVLFTILAILLVSARAVMFR